MGKTMPGLLVYFEDMDALEGLDNAQYGELMRALSEYARSRTEADFSDPSLKIAFALIRGRIDREARENELAEAEEAARTVLLLDADYGLGEDN